jgi:hypothetical protein
MVSSGAEEGRPGRGLEAFFAGCGRQGGAAVSDEGIDELRAAMEAAELAEEQEHEVVLTETIVYRRRFRGVSVEVVERWGAAQAADFGARGAWDGVDVVGRQFRVESRGERG